MGWAIDYNKKRLKAIDKQIIIAKRTKNKKTLKEFKRIKKDILSKIKHLKYSRKKKYGYNRKIQSKK